ncbi:MAG: hypothetical protein NVS3B19_03910 [Ginsengibacter sp.]
MKTTSSKTVTGVGVFAALAASLCCITPLLAILAGASGAASAFSWLELARPFLIGLTVVTLGYAWYKSFSKNRAELCASDGTCMVEKKNFLSSRSFLVLITILAVVLMAFPYYGHIFFPKQPKQNTVVAAENNIRTVSFEIKGMSCAACEKEVNNELFKVDGVTDANTFYGKGISIVKYDTSVASIGQLRTAISSTGYKVVSVNSGPQSASNNLSNK